ncbi:DUF3870 domain-containing protein [Thermovenabulum sp.]|uniref:DUF3870 domain-containing protein n=1 Tax=Thermovenabulum sp. TaxID=3100335 RepID=UPI003C7B9F34
MIYPKNTIYIVGNSKSQQNNPITHIYNVFFIGFVVDKSTGLILDVDASFILQSSINFIKSLFVGRSMDEDINSIIEEIEARYFGSSQKAIIVAFKDAHKKYHQIKNGKKNIEEI